MECSVYIEINNGSFKVTDKKYGYVLEMQYAGKLITREGFGKVRATYHGAVIKAITSAFERFDKECSIKLYVNDAFVLRMAKENLCKWDVDGYESTKGIPVANADLWRELWPVYKRHRVMGFPGTHSYSKWLKEQMKKGE